MFGRARSVVKCVTYNAVLERAESASFTTMRRQS